MYEVLPNNRIKLDDGNLHVVVDFLKFVKEDDKLMLHLRATAYENADDEKPMTDCRGADVFSELEFTANAAETALHGHELMIASCIHAMIGEEQPGDFALSTHTHNSANIRQRVMAVRREKIIAGRRMLAGSKSQDQHAKVLQTFSGIIPSRNTT